MNQQTLDFDTRVQKRFIVAATSGKERSGNDWIVTERFMIMKRDSDGRLTCAEDCDYRSRGFAEARANALNEGKVK